MTNPLETEITKLQMENEKLKAQMICKRCGHDNTQELPKVSKDLLKEYYRVLLTQNVFRKEYSLLDDTIIVTCVEPTRKLLSMYANSWEILGSKAVQYAPDLLCLMLLERIQYKEDGKLVTKYETTKEEREEFFRTFDENTIETSIPEFYQNLPQVILIGLKQVVGTFNDLCLNMSEAIQDVNFWKGVGQN